MISSLTERKSGEKRSMDDKRMAAADSQRNAPVAKATKINSLGCTEGETSDERGGRGGMTKQDEAPKPNLNPDFFVKRCRVCVPGGAERREREREREREKGNDKKVPPFAVQGQNRAVEVVVVTRDGGNTLHRTERIYKGDSLFA